MKRKSVRIFSLILACVMLISTCADIKWAYALEMEEITSVASHTLSIVGIDSNVETGETLKVSLTYHTSSGEETKTGDFNNLSIDAGKNVTIKVDGIAKGRKVRWSIESSSNLPINDAIFGNETVQNKTISDFNKLDNTSVIKFAMPEKSIQISILEANHKIRFYDSNPTEYEIPPKPIRNKKPVEIQELNELVYNENKQKINDSIKEWVSKDPKIAKIEKNKIIPTAMGKGTDSRRGVILAKDQDGNVGKYAVDVVYSYKEMKLNHANPKIYDSENQPQAPDVKTAPSTYNITSEDRVTITAEDLDGKIFTGWKENTSIAGLKVLESNGLVSETEIKDVKDKSFSFIMPDQNITIEAKYVDGKKVTALDADAVATLIERDNKASDVSIKKDETLLKKDDKIKLVSRGIDFKNWKLQGLSYSQNELNSKEIIVQVIGDTDIKIETEKNPLYEISVSNEAKNAANIVTNPVDKAPAGYNVSVEATAKDANKIVTNIVFQYDGEAEEHKLHYMADPSKNKIKMKNKKLIIKAVELADKPVAQNPPSSGGSSSESSSSDNGSSSSGTTGKIERITPKKDKMIKPEPKKNETPNLNSQPNLNSNPKQEINEQAQVMIGEKKVEEVFQDISQKDWFAAPVAFVKEKNLMNGTGEKSFSPNETTDRAMLVSVLYRLAGMPQVNTKLTFDDVKTQDYFANAVVWASEQKIVSGYGNGKFGSHDEITREQMAVILYNYAKLSKSTLTKSVFTHQFADADMVSGYAIEALQWANANGLIKGKGKHLDPQGKATRAEIATIIMRFYEWVNK